MIRRTPGSTLFPYTTLFRSSLLTVLLTAMTSPASAVQFDGNRSGLNSTRYRVFETDVQVSFKFAPEISGVKSNEDRKSTRLNSSHMSISYAVFCLKKKKKKK